MTKINSKDHLPVINLLRGVAASMVMLFHFIDWGGHSGNFYTKDEITSILASHGNMGVYIFFVISGFVIPYSLIIRNYRIRNFFHFMFKRSVRIEIPYIVSIAIGLALLYLFHVYYQFGFNVTWSRTILHLFYLIPFTDHSWYSVIYWTLGVEFQFYLIIALLFPLFSNKNALFRICAFVIFVCANLVELRYPNFSFIYSHTALFTMGIASALYYLKRITKTEWALILVFSFLLCWYTKGLEMGLFGLLTALIMVFIDLQTRIGDFMGKISYSLYLMHTIISNNVLYLFIQVWHVNLSRHIILVICIGITILISWVFWYLVEKPSQKLASRLARGYNS